MYMYIYIYKWLPLKYSSVFSIRQWWFSVKSGVAIMPPTSRPNIPIIHNCLLAVYLLSEGALFNLAHNTIILINIWLNCNMSLIWNKDKLILGHFPRKKNNLIPMRWQRGRYDNLSRYIYIYTIWLFNSLPWKITIFKFGKLLFLWAIYTWQTVK